MDKINETVDKIVGMVIGQASRHQAVKDDVSISIQNAIKDVIAKDLQPDEESGFSFTEYNHLEIYQGPTKLLTLTDESTATDAADGDKANANANNNDSTSRGQLAHGEIIVKVKTGCLFVRNSRGIERKLILRLRYEPSRKCRYEQMRTTIR